MQDAENETSPVAQRPFDRSDVDAYLDLLWEIDAQIKGEPAGKGERIRKEKEEDPLFWRYRDLCQPSSSESFLGPNPKRTQATLSDLMSFVELHRSYVKAEGELTREELFVALAAIVRGGNFGHYYYAAAVRIIGDPHHSPNDFFKAMGPVLESLGHHNLTPAQIRSWMKRQNLLVLNDSIEAFKVRLKRRLRLVLPLVLALLERQGIEGD